MYPAISGLQPEYGWDASYGETADGLMYIGPHRNYPRHLFALGGTAAFGNRGVPRRAHPAARRSRPAGEGRRGVRLDAMTTGPVDLLAFGPHPDDIEIGIGGIVAKHAALGHRVGLCDLTAGEMGSNGTVEERLAEAEAARAVLGAAWRVNLRLPDRAIGSDADHMRAVASLVRPARPRVVAVAVLVRSPSRPRRGEPSAHRRRVQRRPAPLSGRRRGVEARVGLLLLHQRLGRRRRSSSTSARTTR